jgi:uncharacterized protein YgbK (DUF1537 family)
MCEFVIMADDLTGACDTGVGFARQGFETEVQLYHPQETAAWSSAAEVLSIDVGTRGGTKEEAYKKTWAAATGSSSNKPRVIYKKMDSALRGHFMQECDAILEATGAEIGFIAPAYPLMNRTTTGGIHHINGVPVHLTATAQDPLSPVADSNIPRLIEKESAYRAASISVDVLRHGDASLFLQEVTNRYLSGCRYIVVDAETETDLESLVAYGLLLPQRIMFAGSGGLASAIAGHFRAVAGREPQHNTGAGRPVKSPAFLATTSQTEVTRKQIKHASIDGEFKSIELTLGELLLDSDDSKRARGAAEGKAVSGLLDGQDVILSVARHPGAGSDTLDTPLLAARFDYLSIEAFHASITSRFGVLVSRICNRANPGLLFVIGGETARGICEALGVRRFGILREVAPGTVLGEISLSDGSTCPFMTKSGGFGHETLLADVATMWRGRGQ